MYKKIICAGHTQRYMVTNEHSGSFIINITPLNDISDSYLQFTEFTKDILTINNKITCHVTIMSGYVYGLLTVYS